MADGLLSDSRHHASTPSCSAPRRSSSSLFDRRGYFAHGCARAWSWLILKTTGVRVTVEGLERITPGTTYVFVSNHQSIYDTPVDLRVAAVSAADHREGVAGAVSRCSAGTCGAAAICSSIAGIPIAPGILERWRALVSRRAVADHLRRRHAQPRRPRRAVQGAAAFCWRSRPGCRSCRSRSSARAA